MNNTLWKNQDPPQNLKCKCDSGPSAAPGTEEKKEMTPMEDLKAVQELLEFLDGKIKGQRDQLRILALALRAKAGIGLTIKHEGWL